MDWFIAGTLGHTGRQSKDATTGFIFLGLVGIIPFTCGGNQSGNSKFSAVVLDGVTFKFFYLLWLGVAGAEMETVGGGPSCCAVCFFIVALGGKLYDFNTGISSLASECG